MTEKLILAVDHGTSSMKVALITVSGQVLGWETEPIRLIITPDGGAEQSPDDWWAAFLSSAGRLIKRHSGADTNVSAICCSTQGEGTIPVDAVNAGRVRTRENTVRIHRIEGHHPNTAARQFHFLRIDPLPFHPGVIGIKNAAIVLQST